jgi:hypothetical protein
MVPYGIPMSLSARRCVHILVGLCFFTAVAACGGSSSSKSKPSSSAGSSTTASKPTTAPKSGPATEPVSDPVAREAALAQTDIPAGYTLVRKANGFAAIGAQSCAVIDPDPALTTADHVYVGPMFKNAKGTRYVYSEAYAFRSEQFAERFVTMRSRAGYLRCKEKLDDAAERQRTAQNYVKLAPVAFTDPTGHIPTMYREHAGGPNSAGKKVDAAVYDRFTIRHGRVVVDVSIDSSLSGTAGTRIDAETLDTLKAFDGALTRRLGSA